MVTELLGQSVQLLKSLVSDCIQRLQYTDSLLAGLIYKSRAHKNGGLPRPRSLNVHEDPAWDIASLYRSYELTQSILSFIEEVINV